MKKLTTLLFATIISMFAFSQTQLLCDGNFDNNLNCWNYASQATISTGLPYSSPSYGIINGYQYTSNYGIIYQYFVLPTNTISGTISFYYYITSGEGTSTAYDNLHIRIVDGSNTSSYVYWTDLSNLNQSTGYIYWSGTVSSSNVAYINGMTSPMLQFYGENDGSLPTVFRIDNVSLSVNVGVASPIADFSANPTNPCVNTSVQFSDNSANNPTSWDWNFGDGSSHSYSRNPTHTYTSVGNYSVTLAVANSSGSNYLTKSNYITVINCNFAPTADFLASTTNIKRNSSIDFYDQSTNNPTTYQWKFYDGSSGPGYQYSTQKNPTGIIYSNAGPFSVSLSATNAYGTDTKVKPNYITVTNYTGIINTNSNTLTLRTYPNPIKEILNLEFKDDLFKSDSKLKICNQIGGVIIEEIIQKNTSQKQFDFSKLSSGIYFINITTDDGFVITQKVVKE